MSNNYKVYCLTNTITNEKYIGVTKQQLEKRFKAGKGYKLKTKINLAIQKYGWKNFKCKILYKTNDKNLAGKWEEYYIQHFDTINNGYNMQSGGFENFKCPKYSEEAKETLRQIHKGKHYSPNTEFKKGVYIETSRNKKVPILCIETGIQYESIKQAQDKLKLHHIWDCINGKRNKCGGCHWKLIGGEE